MADTVIPRSNIGELGARLELEHQRRKLRSAVEYSARSALSEVQQGWLSPEFTEALVEHMHEAKRLAIHDERE